MNSKMDKIFFARVANATEKIQLLVMSLVAKKN